MNLVGMGLLCSRGRGVDAFRQALKDGWRAPSPLSFRGRTLPVHPVDLEAVPDKAVLKKLRRADKLSKMAVLAAADAVADSGLAEAQKKNLGVIVATAFGAHVTTFEFLDGILDYGESAVSPTVFSNSVHNAAASYISSALGIQGPTLTVTRFFFPVQAALQLADAWLREGRMEHVLVGAVDQVGEVLAYIMESKTGIAPEGRIWPFLHGSGAVPGEGAAFFVLSKGRTERVYCSIPSIRFESGISVRESADLEILDLDGLCSDVPCAAYAPAAPAAAYSPLYGSMMIGSAFGIAAGGLMLREQTVFATPVPDNASQLRTVSVTGSAAIRTVRCVGIDCSGRRSDITLERA
jgi:3-oxoacyl-[acyl-carrier-protein] synthase II